MVEFNLRPIFFTENFFLQRFFRMHGYFYGSNTFFYDTIYFYAIVLSKKLKSRKR